jgi:hypothetical protein
MQHKQKFKQLRKCPHAKKATPHAKPIEAKHQSAKTNKKNQKP